MSDYLEIAFTSVGSDKRNILIANLAETGFEGFEETGDCLKAFIKLEHFDPAAFDTIVAEQQVTFNKNIIRETNWNETWEANFDPVVVDDFAGIRAGFHKPLKGVEHQIVITPKMSFGTGHHATTFLMVQQMRQIDFEGRHVLDFGTGTGILAILAEKLGAASVIAIDNDEWSITNAGENFRQNHCSKIDLRKNDSAAVGGSFDVILANINLNVILDNFKLLMEQVKPGGTLLLSGLLRSDEHDVFRKMDEYSLQLTQTEARDNWLCLKLSC